MPGADSPPTNKGVFSHSPGYPSAGAKAWIQKVFAREREFPARPLCSLEFIICRICTENDPIVPTEIYHLPDYPSVMWRLALWVLNCPDWVAKMGPRKRLPNIDGGLMDPGVRL